MKVTNDGAYAIAQYPCSTLKKVRGKPASIANLLSLEGEFKRKVKGEGRGAEPLRYGEHEYHHVHESAQFALIGKPGRRCKDAIAICAAICRLHRRKAVYPLA